jgi:hypothetical protein
MKISRNDPCPCGSGKKYKKCCGKIIEAMEESPHTNKDHFLSGSIPDSSDMPVFSEKFFKNVDTGYSAYGLINSCILRPEVESLAAEVTNKHIDRGKSEADKIKKCKDVTTLVSMLKAGIDTLNHVLLQNIFLEKSGESVSALLLELRNPVSNMFVEFTVKTVALAKINVFEELKSIIGKQDKPVYQISLLCLLLGYQKHPSIPQFLWNYYRFFQSQFPGQNYWQGPFFGLWEQWASATFDNKKE